MYILGSPPEMGPGAGDSIIVDEGDGSGYWALVGNTFYVRDIGGKEIAIYNSGGLVQWNLWGLDQIGEMHADTTKYYYLKDHLGSTRAVINSINTVVSAQDYDAWGYLQENRTYQSENSRYKFVSSELDNELENGYVNFGLRKYNSRIARFNSEEPYINSSFGWSSYVYSANNPLIIIDPFGTDWFFSHESNEWKWYDDNRKERYMWTGKYNEQGNKTYEKVTGYEELLYFQGSELQFLKKGGVKEIYEAVSGKPNKYEPIPEGKWYVFLSNAYSMDKAKDFIDYLKWVNNYIDQGPAYINLVAAEVNSERQEGFSIHGGWFWGSAGCIDLTSNMNSFYKSFMEYNRNMLLIVNYSNFKK